MSVLNTSLHLGLVASFAVMIGEVAERYVNDIAPPLIEGVGFVNGPVVAGEEKTVHWTIVKRTSCPGVVWRRWQGEDGFLLRGARLPAKIPHSEFPQLPNIVYTIPASAPLGKLDLYIDVEYDCGTGRVHPYTLGPVEMEVVNERDAEEN